MKINCETCACVIAEHDDPAEADELAFEADATHDTEAGIWVCVTCTDKEMAYWGAQFAVLDAEAKLRDMQNDAHENGAMAAYLRAKGEL